MEQFEDLRRKMPISPIYTSGGHGHIDDDDEDFWCPICHEHLGTHQGYNSICPLCGQTISEDFDKCYSFREMKNSKLNKQWHESIR